MEDKKNNFQDKSEENSDIDETMSDDSEVNESSHDIDEINKPNIDETNLTEKIDVSEFLELQKNNEKLNDLLLRARAELDNFQKRTEKQLIQAQLYSTEKLSSELLIIMDSLEAAEKIATSPNLKIEDLIEGNTLLLKTAKEVFGKLNIEEINPLNDKFDPDFHQAMATKDADLEENTVLEVMQKGYKLNSKLLRPALVIVSKKIN